MIKEKYLNLKGNEKKEFFKKLKYYVYVYCEISDDNKRIPIYIGKGKSDRCLSHLDNLRIKDNKKDERISSLNDANKLGIDIIAYGLDNKTALTVESSCIDLMGINNLENRQRGHGDKVKRFSLGELTSIIIDKPVKVAPEHSGCAILINRDYRSTFGDLEIFEITRGIWQKKLKTIAGDSKYAYATYEGVVKEVYEIHDWVPAGTQEYFTRTLDPKRVVNRWEFIGRKAPEDIRKLYVGKLIERERSYGNAFVKVGIKNRG